MTCIDCSEDTLLEYVTIENVSIPNEVPANTEFTLMFDLVYTGLGSITVFYCLREEIEWKILYESSFIELSESSPVHRISYDIQKNTKDQIISISVFDNMDRCQDYAHYNVLTKKTPTTTSDWSLLIILIILILFLYFWK